MSHDEIKKDLEDNLRRHLHSVVPDHSVRAVYDYAVFPPGKLFRPLLVWSIFKDFSKTTNFSDHALLCSALEIHHAYTLVHDDLPCMDDDDFRRGKPSTHKAFGEWKALLAGDGLLNASYQLISKINSPKLPELFRFMSWALGAKGLIHGQVLDLSHEMRKDFPTLLLTHELKTARLIQTALVGSYLLIADNYRISRNLFKLGHHVGISFQLLDDLSEITDNELSEHEKTINPWLHFSPESEAELMKGLHSIEKIAEKYSMNHFMSVMKEYFKKMRDQDLRSVPVMEFLQRLSK